MAVTIIFGVITVLIAAGAGYELSTRDKSLKVDGQNDITEENCDKLCVQLRTRWSELCLARSDETYMRVRWQQAALVAAGAAAGAAALMNAAVAAAASVLGALAAAFLAAAALVALALSIAAASAAANAWIGFNSAATVATRKELEFVTAQTQMFNTCGEERTLACRAKLPACPQHPLTDLPVDLTSTLCLADAKPSVTNMIPVTSSSGQALVGGAIWRSADAALQAGESSDMFRCPWYQTLLYA